MHVNLNYCFIISIILIGFVPLTGHAQNAIDQGSAIIASSIEVHGGKAYKTAQYQFVFRGKNYTFQNKNDLYNYTLTTNKDGHTILDEMNNKDFTRKVNGKKIELTAKQLSSYKEGLNSVIYFASLPYKLQDKAVNAEYVGTQIINDQVYSLVQVTFDKEGGGKDYDDTFMYWINKHSSTMDYMAYSYHVNGGGVRFRSAYNPRRVEGILFQDYVNYKADKETALKALPALWENGDLQELSRILTEEVESLK